MNECAKIDYYMKSGERVISVSRFKNVLVLGLLISVALLRTAHAMESALPVETIRSVGSAKVSRAKANLDLGKMFLKGGDCIQSYEKAREHFELASEQEYELEVQAWACMHLGKMYYFGYGVEKNDAKMRLYLERSCALVKRIQGPEKFLFVPVAEILEVAKILQDQKFDVKALDRDGNTPLHKACRYGNKEIVEVLISLGADVKAVDKKNGRTILHCAAYFGNKDVVEVLIVHGADVKAVDKNGSTPLHWAALKGYKEAVEVLVAHGADVNAMDNYGTTPLHRAAERSRKEVVEVLLAHGADVRTVDKENGCTPLHWAAEKDHKEIVELLLAHGADVKAVDMDGCTPLHFAPKAGNKEVVETLIAHGANVNAVDNYGNTALDYTNRDDLVLNSPKEAVEVLICLHEACRYGNKKVVELLLDRGADVNAVYNNGSTPLHRAAYCRDADDFELKAVVKLLLDKGADVRAVDNGGLTPLHWATLRGYKAVVKLLLDQGADVRALDKNGLTPLHWVAEKGCKEAAEVLIAHSADVKAIYKDGRTSLDCAKRDDLKVLLRGSRGSSCSIC